MNRFNCYLYNLLLWSLRIPSEKIIIYWMYSNFSSSLVMDTDYTERRRNAYIIHLRVSKYNFSQFDSGSFITFWCGLRVTLPGSKPPHIKWKYFSIKLKGWKKWLSLKSLLFTSVMHVFHVPRDWQYLAQYFSASCLSVKQNSHRNTLSWFTVKKTYS
jgi:hypothetical protein